MKILQAISDANIIPKFFEKTGKKLNALLSYPFIKGNAYEMTKKYREMIDLLYFDSGAYSIYKGTAHHNLWDYIKYISRYGNLFDEVFNFDDDFDDPVHNREQFNILSDKVLDKKIIPVIHDNENPLEEIGIYVENFGCDYIAIGSTQKLGDNFFTQVKEKYHDLRLHMFGNLNRKMLADHNPFSADVATYAHMSTFDMIYYWDDIDQKQCQIKVGRRKEKSESKTTYFKTFPHRTNLEAYLKANLDFRYEDLLKSEDNLRIVNLLYLVQLEETLNAPEPEPEPEQEPGQEN